MSNLLANLRAEHLRELTTLFLIGYVFRDAEARVRGTTRETDLSRVAWAIVWSLLLYSGLSPLVEPVCLRAPLQFRLPAALGLYLLSAGLLGWLYGQLRVWLPVALARVAESGPSVLRWLCCHWQMSPGHTQLVRKFFAQMPEGTYINIKTKSGEWYQGLVWEWDRDSERYADMHFTLGYPAVLRGGSWESMDTVKSVLLSVAEVEVIHLTDGRTPSAVADSESDDQPSVLPVSLLPLLVVASTVLLLCSACCRRSSAGRETPQGIRPYAPTAVRH